MSIICEWVIVDRDANVVKTKKTFENAVPSIGEIASHPEGIYRVCHTCAGTMTKSIILATMGAL